MAYKKQILTKKTQLSEDSRKYIVKNLIDRIQAAYKNRSKIEVETKAAGRVEMTPTDKKDYDHLGRRYDELQLSYKLAHNTNWISETRDQEIEILLKELVKTNLNAMTARQNQLMLKALRVGDGCRKCGGHGWKGHNISLGEFNLCSCVKDHLNIYKRYI